ncbi:AzlD domain-containing protein [Phytohabitans kaempferiae]|uniref:AzlD domain-containing protein n=1 Tax=Phytohabitans kaempferiae TaxID=1620943 RepID=A0ABV6MB94_9ACTN
MLATVVLFAVINYMLKAAGPVLVIPDSIPSPARAVVDALPPALLAGMLVSSVVGYRGSAVDPSVLAGLAVVAAVWALRGGQFVTVLAGLAATVLWRLVF